MEGAITYASLRPHLGRSGGPMPKSAPADQAKVPTSEVYALLRAAIMSGDIAPDSRINIEAVSRTFGVSQTPVREALQRLEGDNLIVYTPGRGYSTTALLDLQGLRALFEFRLLVEPWAARAVAVDRLSNPGTRLIHEVENFLEAAAPDGDLRQDMVAHDARFHEMILTATGNPVIGQAYAQTHCHLHIFRLYPTDIGRAATVEEHRMIAHAIANADPETAEQVMSDHIKNSFGRFSRAFDVSAGSATLAHTKRPPVRLLR
ncbi:GntR family transcriptional regulator [Pseudarthrobacter sp. O4]|uniref:GntR family transcriptional regulator n=1 Tax=Pseudarthrobacter sp. O4 TaxID=3418417 RepID=UPI003CF5CA17